MPAAIEIVMSKAREVIRAGSPPVVVDEELETDDAIDLRSAATLALQASV
jgi:hypothetical protein